MAGIIADWAKKGQAGVHCGCCGKWISDQIDGIGAGWGLCDVCADCTEQQVQADPADGLTQCYTDGQRHKPNALMPTNRRGEEMNYIWSDLHINHEAVLRYENRPFKTVDEMNKTILKNWRETVSSNDTIFNLGDVAFKTPKESLEKIIKNLPGKKILLLGNHDRSKSLSWWRDVGFDEVYPYPIIYEGFFMLSHEPLYVGPEMPYVNIHGHTHGECFDNYVQRMNVSVENIDYKPISLDDLVFKFKREEVDTAPKSE